VEVIEEERVKRNLTTKVLEEWDWEYYEKEHGKKATAKFRDTVNGIADIVKEHEWNISYNLNKYYTGFKLGNRVVFNVSWGGTYAWKVKFKIPENYADNLEFDDWEFQRYDSGYNEAVFRPKDLENPNIRQLEPLFVQAYNYIAGTD